jgi:nucleoside-diphosphate-sugar epimerase
MGSVKKCLVTGGTSGIGERLAVRLAESGMEVRMLMSGRATDHKRSEPMPQGALVYIADLTKGDTKHMGVLEEACKGVDAIFHIAGMTNLRGEAPVREFLRINAGGTENLLRACTNVNGGTTAVRFLFMSSIAVYGNRRKGEVLTEESETRPDTAYGKSKLVAERAVRRYSELHPNILYTIFRVANMYGPLYEKFFHKTWQYQVADKLVYVGDGTNHQTLVHVDDVVDCMMLALENPIARDNTYIVSDGQPHTVRELFERAASFLGVPPPHKSVHPFLAYLGAKSKGITKAEIDYMVSDRILSIEKAGRELGFHPRRTTEKEGREMVEEFLMQYGGHS